MDASPSQRKAALTAQRALDHGLLEAPDRDLKFLGGERLLADEMVENFRRNGL